MVNREREGERERGGKGMRIKQAEGKRKHEKGMEREEGWECGRLFIYVGTHTHMGM